MAQAMKQQVSMDKKQTGTVFGILFAISAGHFINDSVQAIVPAMFPI
ncbi:MAG TPA: MFS transporter, partial [Bacilli bacterium]|nr:MFS transporter [Bacilli bacterium]